MKKSTPTRAPKRQAASAPARPQSAAPANPLQHVAMQMFEHGKRVGFKKGVDAAKQHVQTRQAQPQSPQQQQVQKALEFLRNLSPRGSQPQNPLVRRPLR